VWGQILCDLLLLRHHVGYVLMTFPHELSSHTCVYNKHTIILYRIFFTVPQNVNTETYACILLGLVLLRPLLSLDNSSFSCSFRLETLSLSQSRHAMHSNTLLPQIHSDYQTGPHVCTQSLVEWADKWTVWLWYNLTAKPRQTLVTTAITCLPVFTFINQLLFYTQI
jgi:hypothetical protein